MQVAGAWNALIGLDRSHPEACDQDMVIELLKDCLRGRIQRHVKVLEAQLGESM